MAFYSFLSATFIFSKVFCIWSSTTKRKHSQLNSRVESSQDSEIIRGLPSVIFPSTYELFECELYGCRKISFCDILLCWAGYREESFEWGLWYGIMRTNDKRDEYDTLDKDFVFKINYLIKKTTNQMCTTMHYYLLVMLRYVTKWPRYLVDQFWLHRTSGRGIIFLSVMCFICFFISCEVILYFGALLRQKKTLIS